MPQTILIAEDDSILRDLYVQKFKGASYDVFTAEDGEQALAMVKRHTPNIFLCDIHMPKLDGFQVLTALPKDKREYPIIFLTNFDQEEFRKKAQELGADDYFVKKDMTIKSLLDMVKRLLGE